MEREERLSPRWFRPDHMSLAREFLEQAARGASCEVLSEILRRAREQRTIDESVGP